MPFLDSFNSFKLNFFLCPVIVLSLFFCLTPVRYIVRWGKRLRMSSKVFLKMFQIFSNEDISSKNMFLSHQYFLICVESRPLRHTAAAIFFCAQKFWGLWPIKKHLWFCIVVLRNHNINRFLDIFETSVINLECLCRWSIIQNNSVTLL